jgi:hypothetical protein
MINRGPEPFAQLLDHEWTNQAVEGLAVEATVLEPRDAVETPDGRSRPSGVLTATFGETPPRNQPDDLVIRLGLHNERLVPPAGLEPATQGLEVLCSIR